MKMTRIHDVFPEAGRSAVDTGRGARGRPQELQAWDRPQSLKGLEAHVLHPRPDSPLLASVVGVHSPWLCFRESSSG